MGDALNFDPDKTIAVWRVADAPQQLQDMARSDADWIAIIPPKLVEAGESVAWATEGGAFGCCFVESIDLDNGAQVRIGYHA